MVKWCVKSSCWSCVEYSVQDMLPGPPAPLLMGYPSVPSAAPSATPSSSIGASIAIIAIVIIALTLLICCIKALCSSSRPPRPSWSPFSRHSSISRRASSLGESDRKRAAAAAVHASPGASASSRKHAEGLVFGLKVPVPSAPSLPEVELVILGLLSQPPVLLQQGMFCCICAQEFAPTDMILALPACLHKFHERCIIPWIRGHAPYCCPFCEASITIPCPDPEKTHSSDHYDVKAQTVVAPAPPGEEVAGAVGVSRGWLRSSVDRLSGSWRGCSSSHATAVVVPVSSRRTTGSWRVNNSDKENTEAVGGSRGWLHSYLATLSSAWSGRSESHSTTMVSSVSSGCATGSLSLVLSGCGSTDLCSRSWDPEAAVQKT
uniref:RING-H2 finger protein ATL5H n=1 Tax=Aegilops tauschii TaxID=37682 RepID=M8CDR5_AEGTA